MATNRRLVFEMVDQFTLRLMRRMHREMRQIQKEWLIAMSLDEIDGVISQEVGQVLPLRIIGRRIRLEIEVHAHRFDRFIETALAWMMLRIIPQVPFAEHAGSVARLLQRVGDRDLVER